MNKHFGALKLLQSRFKLKITLTSDRQVYVSMGLKREEKKVCYCLNQGLYVSKMAINGLTNCAVEAELFSN